MAEIKAKQRDKSIDIAKGIGIILVVYGHLPCLIREEIYLFHMPLIPLSNLLALPVLKVIYYLIGNITATNVEMMGGRILGLLSLIILVPMSLYIGLLIRKIFPFCFSK